MAEPGSGRPTATVTHTQVIFFSSFSLQFGVRSCRLRSPGDKGMIGSRRKQRGREAISGYSLTAEKCTVPETRLATEQSAVRWTPSGFFFLFVQFFFFQWSQRESKLSASALSVPLHAHVHESGCHFTRPHHTAALQRMSVSLLRTHGGD